MKNDSWALMVSTVAVAFAAGCMFEGTGSTENYSPVTDISGTWAERSVPVPFAGRIDTFTVSGNDVRMRSYLWSDMVFCTEDGGCSQSSGLQYFTGRYTLEDSLLSFRLVPSDAAYGQVPGADTSTYTLVAAGQDLRAGKLKLRRHDRSFIFDRL